MKFGKRLTVLLVGAYLAAISSVASATIVTMDTPLGSFDIQLFDADTPGTTTNFLNYVIDGDYNNSFIHRSVPGFIVQGGGFSFFDDLFHFVPEDTPISNEFLHSNVRGTIAMAKLGGDPDSATNQWFINLADNSANLDTQNGGFTVFGQVMGNGMDVVDAIAALPTYNATSIHSAFTDLPLNGFDGVSFNPASELVFANVSVNPVPVPAAIWLFGSALLGIGGLKRRAAH